MKYFVLCSLLFAGAIAVTQLKSKLGPYPIDPTQVSVGGLSAGAFFAVQYEVAFSSEIMGAGIFAGGPYYCAQGNEGYAFIQCMYALMSIPVSTLVSQTQTWASSGKVDPVSNLVKHKTFLYSGTFDTVVNPKVMQALQQYYQQIGISTSNINADFDTPSEHAMPTNSYGNSCYWLGTPYINDCDYDGAGTALQWIYGSLQSPVSPHTDNIFTFDQSAFTNGDPSAISLADAGYLYIPDGCQNHTDGAAKPCKLHIVFHGCSQTTDDIGQDFVLYTGYNNWAESNNIVVLYPQAAHSTLLGNPNGCFDWWGYTTSSYAWKNGPQMAAVNGMMDALLGN